MRSPLFAFVLVAAISASAADNKKMGLRMVKQEQKATMPVPWTAPQQPCVNWTFAAALESALRVRELRLTQNYIVQRVDYGEVCADTFAGVDRVLERLNGEYAREDGSKVQLDLRWTPGAPTATDTLIAYVQSKQPVVIFYQSVPYLLEGVVYDEYTNQIGGRLFEIRELRMADLRKRSNDEAAIVTFVKGRDNPEELGGILEVNVNRK